MAARLGVKAHAGLVGRWITATLEDGSTHVGVLHTVDPETGNMVLLRENHVRCLASERAPGAVI
jgi:small nuclear ribonucleoprotein (snRNP)-like protein